MFANAEMIGVQTSWEKSASEGWEGIVLTQVFEMLDGPLKGQRLMLRAGPMRDFAVKFPDSEEWAFAMGGSSPVTLKDVTGSDEGEDEEDEPFEDDEE